MRRIKIDEGMYVSDQPSEPELRTLRDDGIRAVMDLRTADEDIQVPQDDERRMLEESGVEYIQMEVPQTRMDAETLDRLRSNLSGLPRPMLIHSPRGRRSKAFGLAEHALNKGWSGEQAVERADEVGVRLDDGMRENLRAYIESRTERAEAQRTTVLRPEKGRSSIPPERGQD